MLKDLIPVIAILGGAVYMFNMSIESEDALFSNHIDDYLDNEMNVKALELVESIRTIDDESEAQAKADADMEEFLELLSNEKYLNKAIAIMNDKKEAANAAAISAQLERNKMIPGLSNIDHDGNPDTDTFKVRLTSTSKDPEGDKFEYLWNQTGGRSVELSADNTRSVTFESTAGEYSFSLKVTDSYGASDTYERDIKVGPELNESPIAGYSAERE
tara:strand:+ start:2499 stop:3146 length:648 start_codon:yes stop_codon:yes gene_type:complete